MTDEGGRKRISTWMHETSDGRRWRIDDFGPGRVRATDIMSPTGWCEWIDWPETGEQYRQLKHRGTGR